MKKSKLSLGLVTALLSVGTLAGCDNMVKSSNRGVLLSYNGNEIYADAILEDYYDDASKYQAIYDSIYSIIVKNYFNIDNLSVSKEQYAKLQKEEKQYKKESKTYEIGSADMSKIESRAQEKIDTDKDNAETNAKSNNTSVKKELEAICASNGVKYDKDLTELREKYENEIKKELFDDDFYTYYEKELIKGAGTIEDGYTMSDDVKNVWEGYFESQVPYHISHILVKVEDSSGKYADGTISEANAKKLYDVVNQIAFGDDSFATIAKYSSDDEGSATLGGDLGIMDTSTSFVNEFKLGLYAYENLYNKKLHGETGEHVPAESHIHINDTVRSNYTKAVNDSDSDEVILPTVDYSVFEELKEYAEVTKSDNEKSVIDDASLVYPRNIVYNKSLNKHSISFITGPADKAIEVKNGVEMKYIEKQTSGGVTYEQVEASCGTGFVKYAGHELPILSVKVAGEWQPILCVRAGSGSYEGIHFIVVNRSAFTVGEDKNGVSMDDYYTTAYPDQETTYPKYKSSTEGVYEGDMRTYVNFSSDNIEKTRSRATELASKLKGFDSDRLNKFIFLKFKEIEGLKIKDEKLDKALTKWINNSLDKQVTEREESWKKTWTEYIDSLQKQNSERTKLVSDTCKLLYKGTNNKLSIQGAIDALGLSAHADEIVNDLVTYYIENGVELYDVNGNPIVQAAEVLNASVDSLFKKEGGLCNDGKEHQ